MYFPRKIINAAHDVQILTELCIFLRETYIATETNPTPKVLALEDGYGPGTRIVTQERFDLMYKRLIATATALKVSIEQHPQRITPHDEEPEEAHPLEEAPEHVETVDHRSAVERHTPGGPALPAGEPPARRPPAPDSKRSPRGGARGTRGGKVAARKG